MPLCVRLLTASRPPVPIEQIRLMGGIAEDFRLTSQALVYEPKYDGVRVKVEILPWKQPGGVNICSRQHNVLTSQFPDLVRDLAPVRRTLKHPVFGDGEIVSISEMRAPLKCGPARLIAFVRLNDETKISQVFHRHRPPRARTSRQEVKSYIPV